MEAVEPESWERARLDTTVASFNSQKSTQNTGLTNSRRRSSKIRWNWNHSIEDDFPTPTITKINTHKALIARAATNIGINEATTKAWVSAVKMARKRKLMKRKKAGAPVCKPWKNTEQ